jgi:hypothetical protein
MKTLLLMAGLVAQILFFVNATAAIYRVRMHQTIIVPTVPSLNLLQDPSELTPAQLEEAEWLLYLERYRNEKRYRHFQRLRSA